MARRKVLDTIESYHRIPTKTYQKLLETRKGKDSINRTLCLCLEEYFQMKEAQKEVVIAEK